MVKKSSLSKFRHCQEKMMKSNFGILQVLIGKSRWKDHPEPSKGQNVQREGTELGWGCFGISAAENFYNHWLLSLGLTLWVNRQPVGSV